MSLRPAAVLARASSLVLLVALRRLRRAPGAAERSRRAALRARSRRDHRPLHLARLQPSADSRGRCSVLAARHKFSGHRDCRGRAGRRSSSVYGGREVAVYPVPAQDEPHEWGGLMGRLVAAAKGGCRRRLPAMSEDQIDKTLFDGITGALDRFSRYARPEIARDQRAVRDGFGGIGVTLDVSNEEFRITAVTPRGPAGSGRHPARRPARRDRQGADRGTLAKRCRPCASRADPQPHRGDRISAQPRPEAQLPPAARAGHPAHRERVAGRRDGRSFRWRASTRTRRSRSSRRSRACSARWGRGCGVSCSTCAAIRAGCSIRR